MSRKFNIGRQSEQSLNNELHNLFMLTKYLNNGPNEPAKDEQADIPYGSLWNDPSFNKNIINVLNPNKGWTPAFKDYYHPANLLQKPENPTDGQIYIDGNENDLMKYYDANTRTWIAVKAMDVSIPNVGVSGFEDFVNIFPNVPAITGNNKHSFLVPNELCGKYFDGDTYIHPNDSEYIKVSDVTIQVTDKITTEKESWIHVNPNRLFSCDKKLIKVNKDITSGYAYQINISNHNTEFYGYTSGDTIGKLLRYDKNTINSDYIITTHGIQLTSKAYNYDYIYAISYSFINTPRAGKLNRKSTVVKEENQIYIGAYNKHPLIFLDGLYLEQEFYSYDKVEGIITLSDTIINPMDMVATIFDNISLEGETPKEYTINQSNINNGKDAIVGPLSLNTQSFVKPIAFVCGVMGGTNSIEILDEVTINGTEATIKNIGPIGKDDTFKVMIIDTNELHISSGIIDKDKTIKDNAINNNSDYLVFVDGLLISPRDYNISEGSIGINGFEIGQQWVLLEVQDKTDSKNSRAIGDICYDAPISYFTLRIEDNNEAVKYNDCDTAIVMADNGTLIDLEAVEKYRLNSFGVNGEIIKYRKSLDNGSYIDTYKVWDSKTYEWTDISNDNATIINNMIGYLTTKGSISILASNLLNKSLTYYAYTYANHIDEPLKKGNRIFPVGIVEHENADSSYKTDYDHMFNPNLGSLSTYVNKLLVNNAEDAHIQNSFTIPHIEGASLINYKGEDLYTNEHFKEIIEGYNNSELIYIVENPEEGESLSCRRETLTTSNRDYKYNNGYNSKLKLLPGIVNVYLNGSLLDKNQYGIIDEHTIVLYFDVVGGKSSEEYDKNILQCVNEDGDIVKIECLKPDELIIEVREDFKLKRQTITNRYAGQYIFNVFEDGISDNMINTKDLIKIYINGVYYTGEYSIDRDEKTIMLNDPTIQRVIGIDKTEQLFLEQPEKYAQYQEIYGKYYPKIIKDKITFEWR